MKEEIKRRVAADLCSCVNEDDNSLHIEFKIPGVKKEDIKLKLLDDGYSFSALRGDYNGLEISDRYLRCIYGKEKNVETEN